MHRGRMSIVTLQKEMDAVKNRVDHLEKILIIGDGDRLPLAEIVRTLTKTVSDYIAQKDKEEQQRKTKEAVIEAEKQTERNKWKWLILGIVVPSAFIFIGQAVVFYFRVLPIIEKLTP